MDVWASVLLSAFLLWLVFFFTAREVSRFRQMQKKKHEIHLYSRSRIVRRCWVSGLIAVEIIFLFVLRFSLSTRHPTWFLIYTGIVFGAAVLLVVLALLDWRETIRQHHVSKEMLYKELVEDVEGSSDPH